jgi:hypothetical protein
MRHAQRGAQRAAGDGLRRVEGDMGEGGWGKDGTAQQGSSE